jgi:3-hydroxyisobutyrate dehydrogenase-like beta-hydroxyacid dehydrogenase
MEKKIGFIGLGSMGLNMAKNLINAGYHLQVYNRTALKANELDAVHITKCKTPADAAVGVPVIISMLTDDEVVVETTTGENGLLKALPKDGVHISMSTISADTSEQLAKQHKDSGSAYVAATVFGRPEAAATKKLWICLSGDHKAKEIARPVLEHLGQGIFDFGESAGAANVVKITGNFMIMSLLETMSEAFTMAEKSGIDRTKVADFFSSTLFNTPIYQGYGKLIAGKQYEPVGFKAKLGYKDARLALKLAQKSETPAPVCTLVHNRLLALVAKNRGDADWVEAFGRGVSEDAGT